MNVNWDMLKNIYEKRSSSRLFLRIVVLMIFIFLFLVELGILKTLCNASYLVFIPVIFWLILTILLFLEIEVILNKRKLRNHFDNELKNLSNQEKTIIDILNNGEIRITTSKTGSKNHEALERLRRKKIIKEPTSARYQEKTGGTTNEVQGSYCEFTEEYLNHIKTNKK